MGTFADLKIGDLLAGRRKIGRFPFPGTEADCGVRLLSDREVDEARADAATYIEARWKRAGFDVEKSVRIDPEALEREHQRQCLVRALVDPNSDVDKPAPFFPSVEKIRDLDTSCVQALWEEYIDWHDAIDPRGTLSDAQVEEIVEAFSKEPNEPALLAHFEPATLRSLLRSMARRLST